MATISDRDRRWIRDEIGDNDPSDDQLQIIFDLYEGDAQATILSILRNRLANFLATAADQSLTGVGSQGTSANINGLREQLKRLGAPIDTDPADGADSNTLKSIRWSRRRTR
jgi:hypothetical protein